MASTVSEYMRKSSRKTHKYYGHTSADVMPDWEGNTLSTEGTQNNFTFISSTQTNFAAPKRAHKNCPELGAEHPQWQTQMTRWGFQHHFLLHILLALSGFHLVREPWALSHLQGITGQIIDYAAEAERHYDAGVKGAATAIPHINGCNSQLLYTAAVFPGEILGFRDDGNSGCISFFMGVRSVLELCENVLSVDVSTSHVQDEAVPNPPAESPLEFQWQSRFPHVFDWLYVLPEVYLVDLQHQQQLALLFLAFFCVLMKDIDGNWVIQGWPEHIMQRIWQSLDPFHQQFAVWPMAILGYSGSESHTAGLE
ncbi:hypothetical protein BDV19DRAFT_383257 [Aspergillus venezuelensis]